MRLIAGDKHLVIPTPLLGELGYLLGVRLGSRAVSTFLKDLQDGAYLLEAFLPEDILRCRELLDKYADLDLGLTDAAVIATAERLNINRILTVDERDFRPIRNARGAPFVLLPADEPLN
jgi:uncharacterized protein